MPVAVVFWRPLGPKQRGTGLQRARAISSKGGDLIPWDAESDALYLAACGHDTVTVPKRAVPNLPVPWDFMGDLVRQPLGTCWWLCPGTCGSRCHPWVWLHPIPGRASLWVPSPPCHMQKLNPCWNLVHPQ